MDDYINREEVFSEINFHESKGGNVVANIRNAVRRLPAADVRENVRGRWLHKQNHEGEWICSLCTTDLAFVYGLESGLPNFCPNCGADMRGK